MISVIITNYNYAPYLEQCLDSVLTQSTPADEIIVVDDGSKDNSRDILARRADPRVKVITKVNGGQGSAFNAGFAASSGELICLLDSDDWWTPDKLARINAWNQLLNGRFSILQHGLTIWHDRPAGPYRRTRPTGDCFAEMAATGNLDHFMPTSALTFRREILARVMPMPEQFRICADAYLMRTACAFGPVVTMPEALGFYRQHQNTVFQNPAFQPDAFFQNQLFPALNDFYRTNGLELRLPVLSPRPGLLARLRKRLTPR